MSQTSPISESKSFPNIRVQIIHQHPGPTDHHQTALCIRTKASPRQCIIRMGVSHSSQWLLVTSEQDMDQGGMDAFLSKRTVLATLQSLLPSAQQGAEERRVYFGSHIEGTRKAWNRRGGCQHVTAYTVLVVTPPLTPGQQTASWSQTPPPKARPQLPKTVSPTGEHKFKYKGLQGIFHIQTNERTSSTLTVMTTEIVTMITQAPKALCFPGYRL